MEMPKTVYILYYGAAEYFDRTEFYINFENVEKKLKEITKLAKENIIDTLRETYKLDEEQINKVKEMFKKGNYYMQNIPTYSFKTGINNIEIKESFRLRLPGYDEDYFEYHFEDYREEFRKEKLNKLKRKGELISNIKEIGDEYIEFHNGMILKSYHDRECCEYHYLDMSIMSMYNIDNQTGETISIYEREFDFSNGIPFEKVEGVGIKLIDTTGNKYLINGYGSNNGYYNSDIELILCYYDEEDGTETDIYRVDVSECQEIDR